jgi:hypothetical protein
MSELTQNFIVQPNDININVDTNSISLTPTDIQLGVYLGGISVAAGPANSLQYNYEGTFGGVPTAKYENGNLTLGAVANVKITGGTSGFLLQTDGTGNLTWTSGTGSGNGETGGSNTQVQYNDTGLFGGSSGFTFDKTTNLLSVPSANIGNTIINNTGIFTPGVYADITGANLISAVTITASNSANLGNSVTANYFIGNALTASTVTSSAQPNISSVGILTSVTSTGNITTTETLGYAPGAGGTVTQTGSRTSAVTLNKPTGKITLVTAALTANTQQQFTFNNTYISPDDMLLVQHVSGGTLGLYNVTATCTTQQATISIRNNSAATSGSQQPVLQFALIKAVVS